MVKPDGHRADVPLPHHPICLRHCRLLENSPLHVPQSLREALLVLFAGAQQLSKQLSRKDSPGAVCSGSEV